MPDLNAVRMVAVQFSFSNRDIVPQTVHWMEMEQYHELVERLREPGGQIVLVSQVYCSILQFIEDLTSAGFGLVSAIYKERIDADSPYGRTYHMVRFLFGRRVPDQNLPAKIAKKRADWLEELKKMSSEAMWRVRIFQNPFYTNHVEVPGVHHISVNCEARTPLVMPDGKPVTARKRSEDGKRVGTRTCRT